MPRKTIAKKDKKESKHTISEKPASQTKKTSRRKIVTPEEKVKKQKAHVEKIVKKQEARLSQHIERVKKKESKGQPANKERFYVTNAKLLEELYKWRDSAPKPKEGEKDKRVITEEFGKMIMMIADRLTNHSNFKNYPFGLKQDMKSYAHFKCIQGIYNYNFEYKNPFAYFTTACYNAFVSTISKYYKEKNLTRDLAKRAIEQLQATADINVSKILNQFVKEYLGEDFVEKENDGTKQDS